MFTLQTGNVVIEAVAMIITGASLIPIMAIAYAFSVELAYP